MTYIQELGRWIAENESLLSGMAALVVLGGVIFSPLGAGLRRVLSRNKPTRTSTDPVAPVVTTPAEPEEPEVSLRQTAADGATGDPLIAVLAFDNLSSDPEMQFFSDGVSEEIIQRLSRGAKLKVIGRTSSFQFRGEKNPKRRDA